MRTVNGYGYYGLQKALGLLRTNSRKPIKRLLFYPIVSDFKILSNLVNRSSWYLPSSDFSQPLVSIIVDPKLLGTDLKGLTAPLFQHSYIGKSENVKLIDLKDANLSEYDAIMLWNKDYMFAPLVLKHLNKINVVDPNYFSVIESVTYAKLYSQTLKAQKNKLFCDLSKRNYQNLLDKVDKYKKGYVFGTGPSLERAMEFDFQDGFSVVCNTIVKNKALLKHIKPHMLAFTDATFFFSPCDYAATFRNFMLEAVQEFQCYVMVQDHEVPLILAHYPQLKNKIIGMPMPGVWQMSVSEIIRTLLIRRAKMLLPAKIPGYNEKYNFPTVDKFYVRLSSNILTGLMVPVVSSVCKDIYFIGVDGRKAPERTYFLSYNASSQFGDLMSTVFETHPSVFRDLPIRQIYEDHCEFFEELVHYGESLGKSYHTLTPSYIPVLTSRLYSKEEQN